jgi:hypothetical protein
VGEARAQTPTAAPPEPPPVTVHAPHRSYDTTAISLSAEQARVVAGTEGDPIKALEDAPAVARVGLGSAALVVWGAAPEDTRAYVDGVEVPSLFHVAGLRSTIDGDLVRAVGVTPGAYGPAYGRGIGGLVTVETADLPARGVHGHVSADALDGSAMLTAAVGDRVRVGAAARVSWLDRVLGVVDAPDVGRYFPIPKYGDAQIKTQIALRTGEKLDVVLLGSRDESTRNVPSADPSFVRTENASSGYERLYLHYVRATADGATVDVVPYVGRDSSDLRQTFGAIPAALDTSAWRGGVRASYFTRPAPALGITLGADVDARSAGVFRSGSLQVPHREGDVYVFGQPPGPDSSRDSWRAGVVNVAPYAAADVAWGPLLLSPGLRGDVVLLNTSRRTPRIGQTPPIGSSRLQGALEPRLAVRLRVNSRWTVSAAAGHYTQPPAPTDLSAVFGNPTLGLESSDHVAVSESLRIASRLTFDAVAFYKWMSGLTVRSPSTIPGLAEALVQDGVGRSYGVQVLLRQEPWHGFFGWIAYTISRSERRDAPGARWRLFDYDEPHVLTAVASVRLGDWIFGARFRFASGQPRTPVVGSFYDAKDDVYDPVFGMQNSIRLPDAWALDLRVDRELRLGAGIRLLFYVEGLDVTDHVNAEEFVYSPDYTRRGVIAGLPALGTAGLRVEL